MFSQLAPELILLIAGHIETDRDLNSLVRVSRQIYQILNAFLYRSNAQRRHQRQYSKYVSILWAAQYGREETLHHALAAGVSPHTRDDGRQTPLIVAARYGQYSIVENLLRRPDADPNEQDIWGRSPLAWAAENGDDKLLQQLLQHPLTQPGLDTYQHKHGIQHCATPLLRAANNCHLSIMKTLLETGKVDVWTAPYCYMVATRRAASSGDEAAFREALAVSNTELDCEILYAAVRGGNKQIVAILLDANIHHHAGRQYHNRLLHVAVKRGDREMLRFLLSRGVVPSHFVTAANTLGPEEITGLLKSLNCHSPICTP